MPPITIRNLSLSKDSEEAQPRLEEDIWNIYMSCLSSVQFSHSVMSDSLRPHGLQHTRPPCPSPTPEVYSNSCLLSRWCHPVIASSIVPFSFHLQSVPASGSFRMSQFFTSGGQSIGFSASATNEYSGLISFRIDWLDLLAVQGTLKSLLQHRSSKAPIGSCIPRADAWRCMAQTIIEL